MSARALLTGWWARVALVMMMLIPCAVLAAEVTRLTHGEAYLQPAGKPAPAVPEPVRLPFSWDNIQGSVDGKARFVFSFAASSPELPHALHTRIGNTFRVLLNGEQIAAQGSPGNPYQDFGKEPQYIRIPADLLRNVNRLEIEIHAQGLRHAGLTPIIVGPADAVQAEYRKSYRLRISAAFAIAIISVALGGLSLLLWARQGETLYFYYGAGELMWALHISDTLIDTSPLPWPWWGVVVFSAYMVAGGFICKFSLAMVDLHKGAIRRVTAWHLLATVPLAAICIFFALPAVWKIWQGVTVVICLITGYLVFSNGIRSPALERRALAIAAAATAAAALRDFFVIKVMPDVFGEIAWVRYAWVIYAITLAWVIAERLRKSTDSLARMNQTLSLRLQEREAELNEMFSRQAVTDRQQAAVEERQRLTRDMHDGIGSQLAGALMLAQDPGTPRTLLVDQLREALDHLKLTVDAMQQFDGDIATTLGALRYRLGPRLQACGITLGWNVQPLPVVPEWSLQCARHLQLILFEAFSNLMTHSQASEAVLSAECIDDRETKLIRIVLADNGKGFDPGAQNQASGQGLSNMHSRAASIGAALHIASAPSGTEIRIDLPISR